MRVTGIALPRSICALNRVRYMYIMPALGDVCCVALSYCVVLPCVVFLSISWMIKVTYIRHVHMYVC